MSFSFESFQIPLSNQAGRWCSHCDSGSWCVPSGMATASGERASGLCLMRSVTNESRAFYLWTNHRTWAPQWACTQTTARATSGSPVRAPPGTSPGTGIYSIQILKNLLSCSTPCAPVSHVLYIVCPLNSTSLSVRKSELIILVKCFLKSFLKLTLF